MRIQAIASSAAPRHPSLYQTGRPPFLYGGLPLQQPMAHVSHG